MRWYEVYLSGLTKDKLIYCLELQIIDLSGSLAAKPTLYQ